MGKVRRAIAQGKMGGGRLLGYRRLLVAAAASLGICGLASLLFYNSPWGMCIFPGIFYVTGQMIQKEEEKRRRRRLSQEFKDYLHSVSAALAAGYSIERAFVSGLKEIRQLYAEGSVLAGQLSAMEKRLSIKEPLERILSDFAEESKVEDIESFVEIFCCAKRGGGDFIQIIGSATERICDKMEVLEEIRTVMAQKALEQKVMCAAPLGILLFFKVTSPEFIGVLYGNLLGVALMTVAAALYGAAFFLGMRIVEIEV